MGKEMRSAPADTGWKKAIPAGRDRMQARVLVWVVGAALIGLMGLLVWLLQEWGFVPRWFASAGFFSAGFALLVWRMRAATGPAAFLGGVVCIDMLLAQPMAYSWRHTALPALVTLFVLTFAATRFGRRRKEALDMGEPRQGRRAAQIVANLGVAGLCAGRSSEVWLVAGIAALAEAAADTVSSEMGQALGGTTWMITSGQRVSAGDDGGVSVAGTALGAGAAAVIAGVAVLSGAIAAPLAGIVFAAGVAGLIFDSVLGATLERRGWIGNDWVNFASTAFAAGVAYLAYGWVRLAGPGIARW